MKFQTSLKNHQNLRRKNLTPQQRKRKRVQEMEKEERRKRLKMPARTKKKRTKPRSWTTLPLRSRLKVLMERTVKPRWEKMRRWTPVHQWRKRKVKKKDLSDVDLVNSSFSSTLITTLTCNSELKEEKDAVKTEEGTKLQNGENTKEGATAAPVVNVSEEKKKATKQRFMFNIADGGFTGGETLKHTTSLPSAVFDLFPPLFRASLSVAERRASRHRHEENI